MGLKFPKKSKDPYKNSMDMVVLRLVSFRELSGFCLDGVLNFRWFLSDWVALYFGVPGLSGLGHLASCLWAIFCLELGSFSGRPV